MLWAVLLFRSGLYSCWVLYKLFMSISFVVTYLVVLSHNRRLQCHLVHNFLLHSWRFAWKGFKKRVFLISEKHGLYKVLQLFLEIHWMDYDEIWYIAACKGEGARRKGFQHCSLVQDHEILNTFCFKCYSIL